MEIHTPTFVKKYFPRNHLAILAGAFLPPPPPSPIKGCFTKMLIKSKVFTFTLQKSQNHHKMEFSLVFKHKNIKKVIRSFLPPPPPPSPIKYARPPSPIRVKIKRRTKPSKAFYSLNYLNVVYLGVGKK